MGRLRDTLLAIDWRKSPSTVTQFKGFLPQNQIQELRHANIADSETIINSALADQQLTYESKTQVLWKKLFRLTTLTTQLF